MTTEADRRRLLECMVHVLAGSPFRHPKTWPAAVVVLNEGAPARATARSALAGEFLANDLPSLAHECVSRRVGRGEILIFGSGEGPSVGAGFRVINLLHLAAKQKEGLT